MKYPLKLSQFRRHMKKRKRSARGLASKAAHFLMAMLLIFQLFAPLRFSPILAADEAPGQSESSQSGDSEKKSEKDPDKKDEEKKDEDDKSDKKSETEKDNKSDDSKKDLKEKDDLKENDDSSKKADTEENSQDEKQSSDKSEDKNDASLDQKNGDSTEGNGAKNDKVSIGESLDEEIEADLQNREEKIFNEGNDAGEENQEIDDSDNNVKAPEEELDNIKEEGGSEALVTEEDEIVNEDALVSSEEILDLVEVPVIGGIVEETAPLEAALGLGLDGSLMAPQMLVQIEEVVLQPVADPIISASAGEGGSISPSGSVGVAFGSNQTFKITPDPGYLIDEVVVDGDSVGNVSSYTFDNVTSDRTISASFVFDPIITASAGPGGSISPSGSISLAEGDNQSFTITPDPGFIIADVLVDGASVGAVASFTFEGVIADATIAASFTPAAVPVPSVVVNGGDDDDDDDDDHHHHNKSSKKSVTLANNYLGGGIDGSLRVASEETQDSRQENLEPSISLQENGIFPKVSGESDTRGDSQSEEKRGIWFYLLSLLSLALIVFVVKKLMGRRQGKISLD